MPDNGIRVRYPLTGYCFAGEPRTCSAHQARSLLTGVCRWSYSELKGGVNAGSLSGDLPPSASRVYDSICQVIKSLHTTPAPDRPREKLKLVVVCLYFLLKAASSAVAASTSCESVFNRSNNRSPMVNPQQSFHVRPRRLRLRGSNKLEHRKLAGCRRGSSVVWTKFVVV